jgi:uncharacterized protein YaiI (UPF0178 family)
VKDSQETEIITSHVKQAEDVIWRRIGDDIVIIKDDGLSTHILNKTAALIWELCDGKHSSDEIAANLCERYDVSLEEARTDTGEIIEGLTKAGLLMYS